MRTRLTVRPGHPGARHLTEIYGDRLVCVRYRYDPVQRRRFKTVELIVAELPWEPPRPWRSAVSAPSAPPEGATRLPAARAARSARSGGGLEDAGLSGDPSVPRSDRNEEEPATARQPWRPTPGTLLSRFTAAPDLAPEPAHDPNHETAPQTDWGEDRASSRGGSTSDRHSSGHRDGGAEGRSPHPAAPRPSVPDNASIRHGADAPEVPSRRPMPGPGSMLSETTPGTSATSGSPKGVSEWPRTARTARTPRTTTGTSASRSGTATATTTTTPTTATTTTGASGAETAKGASEAIGTAARGSATIRIPGRGLPADLWVAVQGVSWATDESLRDRLHRVGARWNPREQVCEMRYRDACDLGLADLVRGPATTRLPQPPSSRPPSSTLSRPLSKTLSQPSSKTRPGKISEPPATYF